MMESEAACLGEGPWGAKVKYWKAWLTEWRGDPVGMQGG
jgi:hypothetical protein